MLRALSSDTISRIIQFSAKLPIESVHVDAYYNTVELMSDMIIRVILDVMGL